MGVIIDGNRPRILTENETELLNMLPLVGEQKRRVQRVWEKCEQSVMDYFMPSPKGTPFFMDIIHLGLLIWFILSPSPVLRIVTGIMGWMLVLLTFSASRRLRLIYSKQVFLTLSPGNLLFYYESHLADAFYHIVKMGVMIILWRCDRIELAIGFLIATFVSIYNQKKLKNIIYQDIQGERDSMIDTMDYYTWKDFSKIAKENS